MAPTDPRQGCYKTPICTTQYLWSVIKQCMPVYTGFGTICCFKHPLGSSKVSPVNKEELLYINSIYINLHFAI